MKTWLHRISHCAEVSHPLLKHGFLSIGFRDFNRPGFIELLLQGGRGYLDKAIQEAWRFCPRSRFSLLKFVTQMKAGDLVVVPTSGHFSVFEILTDLPQRISDLDLKEPIIAWGEAVAIKPHGIYRGDKLMNLGFIRQVKQIECDIPRSGFADAALTSRMKIRETTADMSDLTSNVQAALENRRNNKPINLHGILLARHIESTLEEIRKLLNDAQFERLIKWYLRKAGASIALIPAKNETGKEGDADIVATFDSIRTIIYVQAKKHSGQTNGWALEQIVAYRESKNEEFSANDQPDDGYSRQAWVISTCDSFSEECHRRAKEHGVQLLNGRDFAELLLKAGVSGLDGAL